MRALVIGAVTIAAALLGALLDAVWAAATEGPTMPVLTVGGGLVGLGVGWLVARLAFPRPRQRIDSQRYPNRLIRFDR